MTTLVVKAPAGTGKTTLVIKKIKTLPSDARVEIYVPTHALAEEIQAKLVAEGVNATIIMGRSKEPSPGAPMCKKAELAETISKLGYPVFPVICMGAVRPGDKFSIKRCEYYDDCAYLDQFSTASQVLIYTHAYLPLPRNNVEKVQPALVVIDESFLSTCLQTENITRGQLQELADEDVIAGCVIRKLLRAFDEGEPLLSSLRDSGLSAGLLEEVHGEYAGSGAAFNPCSSDEEFLKRLKKDGRARVRFDTLLKILATEIALQRAESHGVTFDVQTQIIGLHSRAEISRFDSKEREPTFLVIDANANPALLQPWFNDPLYRELVVERKAHVIQCHSTRGSTTSWVPAKNSDPASAERARERLRGIQELIKVESEDGARKVLVVGPQDVTGNPKSKIPPLVKCPKNGAMEHFNGLRGIDAYKDFDTLILIGRNQPSIMGLETMARELWFDRERPLTFAQDWTAEERPYRFRDPTKMAGMEVQVHPDPDIQALHEQIREGESTQVIDRLRLIHGNAGRRVIVLSNIPLGLVVDELVDLNTLLFRKRLDRAWAALDGVMPLNPEWLAGRFPTLWPTAAAARTDLRAAARSGHFSNNIYIRSLTTLTYEYRVAGQARRSKVLSALPLTETLLELSRLLAAPTALREPSGATPLLEHQATMASATLPLAQAQGVA